MTISLPPPYSSKGSNDEKISHATLSYFRQRLRNRLHELILSEFIKQKAEKGLTKAALARLIGRNEPGQITRWLASPGNLRIDTISDLLLAMGAEPELSIKYLDDQSSKIQNYSTHEWLDTNSSSGLNAILSDQVPKRTSGRDSQASSAGLPRIAATTT